MYGYTVETTQFDIHDLMKVFFENEYHSKSYAEKQRMRDESEYLIESPPNRLRVFCFTTRRGDEPDLNAVVDVKSKYWQIKAIELLDGQAYGYNIMKVEKSKPRKRRW